MMWWNSRPTLPPAAALVLAAALAAGCSSATTDDPPAAPGAAAGYPVTVSNCGRDYTFPTAPSRVVVGYPTSLETLVALDVTDRVAGYLSGDVAPLPEGVSEIPVISPQYNAPREALLGAQPDLVIFTSEVQASGDDGTATVDDLLTAGANSYVLQGNCVDAGSERSIDDVYSDVERLGEIFGVPDRATTLATELRGRVDAVADRRGSQEPVSVAFVQVFDGQLYALGGGTYDAVLSGAGVTNEFAGLTGSFAQISPEEVLTLDPGHLLVAYSQPDSPEDAVARVAELLANSSAVAAGRLLPISSDKTEAGGVSLIDVVEQVGQAVYG